MKKVLVFLVIVVVFISGCVNQELKKTPGQTTGMESTVEETQSTSQAETQTSTQTERPSGIETVRLFNESKAVNLSLVPEETIDCTREAPKVIGAYYSTVKDEKDVSQYFDLSVVDNESLKELHEALYKAVDFKDINVSNFNCSVASSALVACTYHYSATLEKDGETRSIEKNYVTFLTGDGCKIIWTEESG